MTTSYSLDQLRADIEVKYGPFVIDLGGGATATLEPMMRLPKDRREQFTLKQRELSALQDDDAELDQVGDAIVEILRIVAKQDGSFDRLEAALPPDDMSFRLELFEQYANRSQPGEASPSET